MINYYGREQLSSKALKSKIRCVEGISASIWKQVEVDNDAYPSIWYYKGKSQLSDDWFEWMYN